MKTRLSLRGSVPLSITAKERVCVCVCAFACGSKRKKKKERTKKRLVRAVFERAQHNTHKHGRFPEWQHVYVLAGSVSSTGFSIS